MLLSTIKAILFCLFSGVYLCRRVETITPSKNVSVSAVLAFGDSFLDSGNNNYINTLGKANFLPYGKDFEGGKPTGRFSNGRTIADILTKAFGVKEYLPAYLDPSLKLEDFLSGVSFASAGSGYDNLTVKILKAIPLSSQSDNFKEYIRKLKKNIGEEGAQNLITKSVFLVVVSTNDLLISLPIKRIFEHVDVSDYANQLVNLALDFVKEIYELGARKIALFSAPPVGCFPAIRTIAGGEARNCKDDENEAAQSYNSMLKQQLEVFATNFSESRVAFVDFYNPLISIIENSNQYGLEVTDKGCCGTGNIELGFLCNKFSSTCYDDSKYLFWDSIHLSEEGCEIFINLILPDLMNNLFYDNPVKFSL